MSKLTNLVLLTICLFGVLGCKTINELVSSGTPSATPTTTSSSDSNTSPTRPNKLVGTWVGKSADGSNDLKWIFTENEFTVYSNGKIVVGNQKYVFKDDETLEVTPRQGNPYPLKVRPDGDTLSVEMKGTKVKLRRQS